MREMQKERVQYLKDYVNLEFEAFDNLLEILPSSILLVFPLMIF